MITPKNISTEQFLHLGLGASFAAPRTAFMVKTRNFAAKKWEVATDRTLIQAGEDAARAEMQRTGERYQQFQTVYCGDIEIDGVSTRVLVEVK